MEIMGCKPVCAKKKKSTNQDAGTYLCRKSVQKKQLNLDPVIRDDCFREKVIETLGKTKVIISRDKRDKTNDRVEEAEFLDRKGISGYELREVSERAYKERE
jgi:hypothetical protein